MSSSKIVNVVCCSYEEVIVEVRVVGDLVNFVQGVSEKICFVMRVGNLSVDVLGDDGWSGFWEICGDGVLEFFPICVGKLVDGEWLCGGLRDVEGDVESVRELACIG
ncbi:hypothetical protein TcasGA2_TC010742 [Tribolium castaneum]|uniref:Uncharacterized protein n=1 Tax=Tribolium castaneum TaxID=7070 RepID=D7EK92_TRICA|nr:hypothetical protein TcasGA2_TC010742 [Tribolium castaneum]